MRLTAASRASAVGGVAARRARQPARAALRAVASAAQPTPRQVEHGHGAKGAEGWRAAGWDLSKRQLDPHLQGRLLTYGELVQAAYDSLVWDLCSPRYGDTRDPPAQAATSLLGYLTADYSRTPAKYGAGGAGGPGAAAATTGQGTRDKYQLAEAPGASALSPLIRALPGQGKEAKVAIKLPPPGKFWSWLWANRERLLDFAVYSTGSIATKALSMFGNRPLFGAGEARGGRGVEPCSAFMGYAALSQPSGPGGEVDAVFVWRGTIFMEEWGNNFSFDRLAKWDPQAWQAEWEAAQAAREADPTYVIDAEDWEPVPAPWEVGVHAGFYDLYTRPCCQHEGVLEADQNWRDKRSPRQVVHAWLRHLLKSHKVATISTTGHSLGGALCTLCAFDVAQEVARLYASGAPQQEGWRTQAKPTVTAFAWASPRVGNYSFLKEFSDSLGARALRVCNKSDPVPMVPGIWVQFLTWLASKLRLNVWADKDAGAGRAFAQLYHAGCCFFALFGRNSRWGYTHVGQILEVDSDRELGPRVADGTPADASALSLQTHNLELYLYLLSKFGQDQTSRNFFLMNKSDALVGDPDSDSAHPAGWWRAPGNRGMALDADGRWDYKPAGSAPAAPQKTRA